MANDDRMLASGESLEGAGAHGDDGLFLLVRVEAAENGLVGMVWFGLERRFGERKQSGLKIWRVYSEGANELFD